MSKPKNVTFSLPPELIDRYKTYVQQKFIPSVNAGVREALEEYSKRIDKEMLKNEMLKASKDPIFLKDLNESIKDFELVDEESAKENSEW
jgi:protein involved in temperature-dependent protein secretion